MAERNALPFTGIPMNTMSVLRCSLALVLAVGTSVCTAGVTVVGTRVIFPASDREATIQVRNEGGEDIMIQSWIEPAPGQAEVDLPFAITPSLARLSQKKQQALRIFYQGKGLPVDRESVFWLSVQEIPQLSKSDNNLQIAFRQRLKVFYRPTELSGSADDAAKNLKWGLSSGSGETSLVANNPSAFHVSLGGVTVLVDGRKYPVEAEMVPPQNSSTMKVKGLPQHIKGGAEVQWESINDYGAQVKHAVVIQP